MGDKKGAEGGEGDHQDGDTSLGVVPEQDPGHVERAVFVTQAGDLDHGRYDHEDAEAERQAQAQFLARFDSDLPEQTHRNRDNQYVGQDIQDNDGGRENEGLEIVRIHPAFRCDSRIS